MRGCCTMVMLLLGSCTPALTLPDLDGHLVPALKALPQQPLVLVFLSHECPIANQVAPVLDELAQQWGERVAWRMVHVDPDLTAEQARAHQRDYHLPGLVLRDAAHELCRHLAIERTPTAVLLRQEQVLYHGAINDQWTNIGARRQQASRHYLSDAIAAALAGNAVHPARTAAVGCLLPEPARR